ncbi:hypothetical protein C7M84_009686 [Penaeus vannamei]|uniref:Peptidase S1 domain-containing protein n=1 Tax=Penaeus vannamei TaxID=6689 RepID=A0A3R7SRK2_PENVA|nr:hypothetical protein C7M84_009686 [Penaeus vannamei]
MKMGSTLLASILLLLSLSRTAAPCSLLEVECDGQCRAACDSHIECSDGSDESPLLCKERNCPIAESIAVLSPFGIDRSDLGDDSRPFRCAYGGCISPQFLCNGHMDCWDGSDETEELCLPRTCPKRTFRCKYGGCLKRLQTCDGKAQCFDGSDEDPALCKKKRCYSRHFQCAYGACIRKEEKCDGNSDCFDSSDETPELCGPDHTFTKTESRIRVPPALATESDFEAPFPSTKGFPGEDVHDCDGVQSCPCPPPLQHFCVPCNAWNETCARIEEEEVCLMPSRGTLSGIEVEVLSCGANPFLSLAGMVRADRECGTSQGVPVLTVATADCWGAVTLIAECHADGLWYPYGEPKSAKPMRHLCQPHALNADVCGKRARYVRPPGRYVPYETASLWPWLAGLFRHEKYACAAALPHSSHPPPTHLPSQTPLSNPRTLLSPPPSNCTQPPLYPPSPPPHFPPSSPPQPPTHPTLAPPTHPPKPLTRASNPTPPLTQTSSPLLNGTNPTTSSPLLNPPNPSTSSPTHQTSTPPAPLTSSPSTPNPSHPGPSHQPPTSPLLNPTSHLTTPNPPPFLPPQPLLPLHPLSHPVTQPRSIGQPPHPPPPSTHPTPLTPGHATPQPPNLLPLLSFNPPQPLSSPTRPSQPTHTPTCLPPLTHPTPLTPGHGSTPTNPPTSSPLQTHPTPQPPPPSNPPNPPKPSPYPTQPPNPPPFYPPNPSHPRSPVHPHPTANLLPPSNPPNPLSPRSRQSTPTNPQPPPPFYPPNGPPPLLTHPPPLTQVTAVTPQPPNLLPLLTHPKPQPPPLQPTQPPLTPGHGHLPPPFKPTQPPILLPFSHQRPTSSPAPNPLSPHPPPPNPNLLPLLTHPTPSHPRSRQSTSTRRTRQRPDPPRPRLVRLEKPVLFSRKLVPACVLTGSFPRHDVAATFNRTVARYRWEMILQQHDPRCHSPHDRCATALTVDRDQFCGIDREYQRYLPQGSSGGPYLVNLGTDADEKWTVVGVVSSSYGEASCSRPYTIFTAVGNYWPWIERCVYLGNCSQPLEDDGE